MLIVVEKPWTRGVVDNWPMAKKRIPDEVGLAALQDLGNQEAMAVRYLLQQLETEHPGGTIELRVPPFGAVQLVGGLNHRRGTPPNVVEINPGEFLALALGTVSWEQLTANGLLLASGARAGELRNLFPLPEVR
jgi:hypothetical protein